MKLKIKLQKEGRGYVALCEDFSLNAQAPTMRGAIKHIEEAFYFAIQFPDFVEAHKDKLVDLMSKPATRASDGYLNLDANRFLESVRFHAPASLSSQQLNCSSA